MTTIHLIIGLPGSGKTHYAKSVLGHLPLVDDITDQNQLLDASEFVITDISFCDADTLLNAHQTLGALYPGVTIKLVYFENDADKARANVKRRNDGRDVEGTIKRFEKIYQSPADALKIFVDN